jgi:chromosome segregation ATPase
MSMVQPAHPTNSLKTQDDDSTVKELQRAKVDAINARTAESMAQRKLADTEADLRQAKDETARATKEAQQAKADAEADLKQAKDEAARATKEAQQAKADAQVARQSKAEAERKLTELEATEKREQNEADPLGTWLRGLGAWLRVGLFGPPNPENP